MSEEAADEKSGDARCLGVSLAFTGLRNRLSSVDGSFSKVHRAWFLWGKPTIHVDVCRQSPKEPLSCRCLNDGQCTTTCVKSSSNADLANYSPTIRSQYT